MVLTKCKPISIVKVRVARLLPYLKPQNTDNTDMKFKSFIAMLAALAAVFLVITPTKSEAAIIGVADYNDSITAIFGTGNPDGSWTSATSEGTVSALRFRERFTTNMPNDGAGTYTFALGTDVNFDFSLNSGTPFLSEYTYSLGIDIDPSTNELYVPFTFDPIFGFADNSYGNSGTANSAGVEGNFTLSASNTVSQNSQRLAWYGIDTSVAGEYTNFLTVSTKGASPRIISGTEATVVIGDRPPTGVPDYGSTLGLSAIAMGGCMLAKRRSDKTATKIAA